MRAGDSQVRLYQIVESALLTLSVRERRIVEARAGLLGPVPTLEVLGDEFGVTRERVRQLDFRALKRIRASFKDELAAALADEREDVWQLFAAGLDFVERDEVGVRSKNAHGHLRLALKLCDWSLKDWLQRFATPHEGGWLRPGVVPESVSDVRERVGAKLRGLQLPVPVTVLDENASPTQLRPILGSLGYSVSSGYVQDAPWTRRARRMVGLHRALLRLGVAHLETLLQAYRERCGDEYCNHREAESLMSANRHLFVHVADGVWAPVARSSSEYDARISTGGEALDIALTPPLAAEYLATADPWSVAGALGKLIHREGPMHLGEIYRRSDEVLVNGQSKRSIGPILTTQKHIFRRLLPGFYGLRDTLDITSVQAIKRLSPIFAESQIILYTYARHSGAPLLAFPLWNSTTEALWTRWAQRHAQPMVLESLMSVIDPSAWPLELQNGPAVHDARASRYRLWFPFAQEGTKRPPLRHLFAAAVYVRVHGGIGWIDANRVVRRRLADNAGGSVLALLVGLEVLEPSDDWHAQHTRGPQFEAFLAGSRKELEINGQLTWGSAFGKSLVARALQFEAPKECWFGSEVLQSYFDGATSRRGASGAESVGSLEALLRERAITQKRLEATRALELLQGARAIEGG